MEELSKMAMAYYQASSDHIQKLARDFFNAMDHDGDGKIDQTEFLTFMSVEGYSQMTNPSFFNQLDLDKNGTLDFFEVMTVFYIVKSGRPFCDECKKFIASTYLTCLGCLEDPVGGLSFYLCVDCYIIQKCNHTHDGLYRFLDNYSLLEAMMTKSKLNELRSTKAKSRPTETNLVPGKPPMNNNHTWNPPMAMAKVPYNWPPMAMAQPRPMSNNHTWINPSTAMVQVPVQMPPMAQPPYMPPPIHGHYHSSSQGVPNAPPVQNHTWNQHNYYYQYQPPRPAQHVGAPNNAIVPLPQRQDWTNALAALNAGLQFSTYFCSIL